MSPRLRIGIFGAGLITQAAHLPALALLRQNFDVTGLFDLDGQKASEVAGLFGIPAFNRQEALWELKPDAIIIAASEREHYRLCSEAIHRHVHILCEKPLCNHVVDILALNEQLKSGGIVFQVGYMKRWDRHVLALREMLLAHGEAPHFIGVEVTDPDFGPFVNRDRFFISKPLKEPVSLVTKEQTERSDLVFGRNLTNIQQIGFNVSLGSSLIHDINLVRFFLEATGVTDLRATAGNVFRGGFGSACCFSFNGDAGHSNMAHVLTPNVSRYSERLSFHFDDRIYELEFRSPYLLSHLNRLLEIRGAGQGMQIVEHRISYEEAFVEQLRGFWEAIVNGRSNSCGIETALADMSLIEDVMRAALAAA